jgi:hypothetical protein
MYRVMEPEPAVACPGSRLVPILARSGVLEREKFQGGFGSVCLLLGSLPLPEASPARRGVRPLAASRFLTPDSDRAEAGPEGGSALATGDGPGAGQGGKGRSEFWRIPLRRGIRPSRFPGFRGQAPHDGRWPGRGPRRQGVVGILANSATAGNPSVTVSGFPGSGPSRRLDS